LNASYRWNFALTRVSLGGADEDAPVFGFTYAYSLPADLLRLWETNIPRGIDFKVESNKILTDETSVSILYSRLVTTVSSFTLGFQSALEYRLASELAMIVTREPRVQMAMFELYTGMLHEALATESQEYRPPVTSSDDLILPRFGGASVYIPLSVS
jgi:hypothetical protein